MPFVDHLNFATNDAEAAQRFLAASHDDPFPEVAEALLNSADIIDYVRMTGMLYPFHRSKVKSASYEAAIRGRCIWWGENEERQEKLLEDENEDEFVLKANSIAFVQVEPQFRLPDYIAIRFNLKIEHVHRGILLGTGPLVDPGFVGKLLIPLHNLTTNEYAFKCGIGLIWIEFTKSSRLGRVAGKNTLGLARYGEYVHFPDRKKNLEPEYYFLQASPYKPIRSSIPEAVRESRDAAISSAKQVKQARNLVLWVTGIGGLIFILTLAGVTYTTWSLIQDTWKLVDEVRDQLRQDIERDKSLQRKAEDVEQKAQLLEKRLSDEFKALQGQMDRIARQKKVSGIRSDSTTQDAPK